MSHPGQHDQRPPARADQPRSAFGAARLELPRFQFAPSAPAPAPAQPPASAPAGSAPAPQPTPAWLQPRPSSPAPAPAQALPQALTAQHQPAVAWNASSTPMPPATQHAPTGLRYATVPAPVYSPAPTMTQHAVAPPVEHAQVQRVTAPSVMANQTRPAAVSWERLDAPADRTLLQRISPVHMGVLMVMVVVAMVVSAGPASMSAKPGRLPALATSGGGSGVPTPIRAGAAAVAGAKGPASTSAAGGKTMPRPAAAATAAPGAKPAAKRARMLAVGSARLNPRVRAGGIPSPAASANLAIAGGGRVAAGDTASVRMGGIPSAAASEQLGPQTLPFRPTDGVTLPRSGGERDNYAVDTHYGNDTLPMEEPALPAMTPCASAARAEHQVQVNSLTGGSAPTPVAGGLAIAH